MEQEEARDQEKTWAQMEDDRMVAFLFESRGKAKHRTGMTGGSTSWWWVLKGWREVTPMSMDKVAVVLRMWPQCYSSHPPLGWFSR